MLDDYKVPFRTEESIRRLARDIRKKFGLLDDISFNVVNLVKSLVGKTVEGKGELHLEFYDIEKEPFRKYKAYVTYEPLTLHIDREVWDLASLGDPESRFIVAHELGHILLHDRYAVPFSNVRKAVWKAEESSESQANWFADALLILDEHLKLFLSPVDFELYCLIPAKVVERRRQSASFFTGDNCTYCGNFTLVRTSLRTECRTCRTILSCS